MKSVEHRVIHRISQGMWSKHTVAKVETENGQIRCFKNTSSFVACAALLKQSIEILSTPVIETPNFLRERVIVSRV